MDSNSLTQHLFPDAISRDRVLTNEFKRSRHLKLFLVKKKKKIQGFPTAKSDILCVCFLGETVASDAQKDLKYPLLPSKEGFLSLGLLNHKLSPVLNESWTTQ